MPEYSQVHREIAVLEKKLLGDRLSLKSNRNTYKTAYEANLRDRARDQQTNYPNCL